MENNLYNKTISVPMDEKGAEYAVYEKYDEEEKKPLEIDDWIEQDAFYGNNDNPHSQTSMRLRAETIWTLEVIKRQYKKLTGTSIFHGEIIEDVLFSFLHRRAETKLSNHNFNLRSLYRTYVNRGIVHEFFIPSATFHPGRIQSLIYLSLFDIELLYEREKALLLWILNNRYFNKNANEILLEEYEIKPNQAINFNIEELKKIILDSEINFENINLFFYDYNDQTLLRAAKKTNNFTSILENNNQQKHVENNLNFLENMDSEKYFFEIKQPWSTNMFMGLKSISRVCGRIEQRAQGIAALMRQYD